MDLTINKEIFLQQLLEIDLALMKYENQGILHEKSLGTLASTLGEEVLVEGDGVIEACDPVLLDPAAAAYCLAFVDITNLSKEGSKNPITLRMRK